VTRHRYCRLDFPTSPRPTTKPMAIGNASPSVANTTLNYAVPPEDGSKAYLNINADPSTGKRASNYATESRPSSIENVRGKQDSVSLDTAGFQFYQAPATHKSFSNDDEIEQEYIPESIELLKRLTGASKVVIFDHSTSRNPLFNTFCSYRSSRSAPTSWPHRRRTFQTTACCCCTRRSDQQSCRSRRSKACA